MSACEAVRSDLPLRIGGKISLSRLLLRHMTSATVRLMHPLIEAASSASCVRGGTPAPNVISPIEMISVAHRGPEKASMTAPTERGALEGGEGEHLTVTPKPLGAAWVRLIKG